MTDGGRTQGKVGTGGRRHGGWLAALLPAAVPAAVVAGGVFMAGGGWARERPVIVGEAQLQPLLAAIAQRHDVAVQRLRAADVLRRFCDGAGPRSGDLALTTQVMGEAQRQACRNSGVERVNEVTLGRVALVLVQAAAAPRMSPTPAQLHLALAAKVPVQGRLVPNPYRRWDEISPALALRPIRVLLPAVGSGAGEALRQVVMERVCVQGMLPYWRALRVQLGDDEAFLQRVRRDCVAGRKDGRLVTVASPAEMARRLAMGGDAVGVMLQPAFLARRDGLVALPVGGVLPEPQAITRQIYPLTLAVRLYIKVRKGQGVSAHPRLWPALQALLRDVLSERALARGGFLMQRGLAPLPAAARKRMREAVLDKKAEDGMRAMPPADDHGVAGNLLPRR